MADDTSNLNGRMKVTVERLLTLVIAVLLAYAAMTSRVSVIEAKQQDLERRLERMEDKLDILVQRQP